MIKEFKAPPRDANGKSDAAKQELRKYVPDALQVSWGAVKKKEYAIDIKGNF